MESSAPYYGEKVNTDEEWEVGAEYGLMKHLPIAGSYHSEFYGGAGLLVRF